MDISKTIQELYSEKEKVERAIASLEELQRVGWARPAVNLACKRRGRKSMDAQERRQVSERMKKYGASRRGRGRACR
jgi:hypothetical protein